MTDRPDAFRIPQPQDEHNMNHAQQILDAIKQRDAQTDLILRSLSCIIQGQQLLHRRLDDIEKAIGPRTSVTVSLPPVASRQQALEAMERDASSVRNEPC